MTDLLPDLISPVMASVLVLAAFLTSALTSAVGIGGGLVLLAVMSAIMPPAAVIPVHGVSQLGANSSRFVFLGRHTAWPILIWFSLGTLLGAGIGAQLYVDLPGWMLRFAIGLFVLFAVWGPKPKGFSPSKMTFGISGAISSFLTMFVGATGPFVAGMLATTSLDRQKMVSTHAAAMVIQHGMKTLVFGFIGFAFADWAFLLAAIIAAGFLGAGVGARILHGLPEKAFRHAFNWTLTIVASYLLFKSIAEAVSAAFA